jgi:hypothetical protein
MKAQIQKSEDKTDRRKQVILIKPDAPRLTNKVIRAKFANKLKAAYPSPDFEFMDVRGSMIGMRLDMFKR